MIQRVKVIPLHSKAAAFLSSVHLTKYVKREQFCLHTYRQFPQACQSRLLLMSKKIGIQALEWRRLWESPTKYFGTPPRCSWKHLLQSQRKAEKSRLFCSSHFGKERLTLKREPAGKAIGKERSVWASRLDLLKWEEPVMFQYWAALPLLLTPRLSPSIPDVKTQDRKIQFRILSARSPKPHWPLTDPFWPQSCPALEHYGLIGPSRNRLYPNYLFHITTAENHILYTQITIVCMFWTF